MPKASSIIPDRNISILLKGTPGIGKTIAACSFAIFGDVYLAYFDKRQPVELIGFFKKIGREDLLDRIEFDSFNSSNPNEYLNKLIKLGREPGKYVATITDSVTSLTSAAVNWSLGFRDPGKGKKQKEDQFLIPDFDQYKTETSLVSQALDLCKLMPGYSIWVAHPLPKLDIAGSSSNMTITKSSTLVSYGQKVGSMIPASFTEVYHFGRQVNKRIVFTDAYGEDYAKTSFNLPQYFDITDRLFAEVWKPLMEEALRDKKEVPSVERVERTSQSDNMDSPQITFPSTKEGQTRWRV